MPETGKKQRQQTSKSASNEHPFRELGKLGGHITVSESSKFEMAARASVAPFWLLAAAAVALLVAAASAQSNGGSSDDDCTSTLVSLSPCMDYISGNGSSSPSASCCSQLKSVVQSKPQCLCAALGSDASSLGGVTIDRTRALALPSACNVQTPPASQCNGGSSGGGGSKATPSLPSGGGASLRGPPALVLGLAAAAVYVVAAV